MINSFCQSFILSSVFVTSAFAEPKNSKTLKIQTITASESGFLVNSHIITGTRSAVLVDAQFTKADSQVVIDTIKKTGKKLETIFITHGHPDHYFGLSFMTAAFPDAKVVTTKEVLEDMKATSSDKFKYWKPIYKENLTDKVIFPKVLDAKFITLEGEKIQISKVTGAEAHEQNVLNVVSANALLTGDLVYSNTHLWLAEGRGVQWIAALKGLKSNSNPSIKIYPGHGPAGGTELLDENIQYIESFESSIKSGSAETAKSQMKAKYPKFALPVILDIATDSALPAQKK